MTPHIGPSAASAQDKPALVPSLNAAMLALEKGCLAKLPELPKDEAKKSALPGESLRAFAGWRPISTPSVPKP